MGRIPSYDLTVGSITLVKDVTRPVGPTVGLRCAVPGRLQLLGNSACRVGHAICLPLPADPGRAQQQPAGGTSGILGYAGALWPSRPTCVSADTQSGGGGAGPSSIKFLRPCLDSSWWKTVQLKQSEFLVCLRMRLPRGSKQMLAELGDPLPFSDDNRYVVQKRVLYIAGRLSNAENPQSGGQLVRPTP